MNLGKLQKNIYIGNTGARYIRNRYLLYIGILSGGEPKKKKCLFPIYKKKKHCFSYIRKYTNSGQIIRKRKRYSIHIGKH